MYTMVIYKTKQPIVGHIFITLLDMDKSLRLMSFNCNGLDGHDKRREVYLKGIIPKNLQKPYICGQGVNKSCHNGVSHDAKSS